MGEVVIRRDEGRLCTLTLNRPEKRNAITSEMLLALGAHCADLSRPDSGIDCVVLRGAPPSFCAGVDLNGLESGSTVAGKERAHMVNSLACLPQPLIAAVQGHCMTGGLELALTADLIIADDSARFADTHGKWGLVPGWGMTQRLPRRVGLPMARRMMFTSCTLDAQAALAAGLVDIVAGDEGLDAAIADLVGPILANSSFSLRHVKQLLRDTSGMSEAQGVAHEHFHHAGAAPDRTDRISAFTRK